MDMGTAWPVPALVGSIPPRELSMGLEFAKFAVAWVARLAVVGFVASVPSTTHAAEPFRVVAFAGASNLPLWAGQDNGLFARRGLDVVVEITPNSVELARNLEHGRYDLAFTAIDNVVAYDEGEGESGLDAVDFVALFGVDEGMLSLVAKSGIPSIRALQGHLISVDAATTGFAFALREILERVGVVDASFVKVGGGAQRLGELIDGKQDATLLNTPLDIVAERRGYHALARVTDELGAYQGIVAVVRREQVLKDQARLVEFARGFRESIAWLAEPEHHGAVVALLVKHMPSLSPEAAEQAASALLDPRSGIYRDLHIDGAGLRTVLALRSKYARPRKDLTDPTRYMDLTIAQAAIGPAQ